MKGSEIEQLVRPCIRSLCPYSTARDEFQGELGVFLDANESPYPTGYNRYPDPHQKALKERISQLKGVSPENIFLGNGSDEAIDLAFRIFCIPGTDNAVAIEPSYGMYSVAAEINDVKVKSVTLEDDFSLPVERLLAACDEHTKLMFLCSPNNPSGNAFPVWQLREIISRFHGIVIVDEAYGDFSCQPSLTAELASWPNLIVFQTFSKAWGMAGLRLGLAFAQPYIIRLMSRVKYPYNINQETQRLVMKALENPIVDYVDEIKEQRAVVAEKLKQFACVSKIYPSEANFLLVKVDDADAAYTHLIGDGIIVRNRTSMPLCHNCLRITIGLKEENVKLIESFERYEKSRIRR